MWTTADFIVEMDALRARATAARAANSTLQVRSVWADACVAGLVPSQDELSVIRADSAALLSASALAATDIELVRATHEALATLRGRIDAVRAVAACRAAMASHLTQAREEARAMVAAARNELQRGRADAVSAQMRSEYSEAMAAAAQDESDALRRQLSVLASSAAATDMAPEGGSGAPEGESVASHEPPSTRAVSSVARASSGSVRRPLQVAPHTGSPALWMRDRAPVAARGPGSSPTTRRTAPVAFRAVALGSHDDSFPAFAQHAPRSGFVGSGASSVATGRHGTGTSRAMSSGVTSLKSVGDATSDFDDAPPAAPAAPTPQRLSPTRFSPVEPIDSHDTVVAVATRLVVVTLPVVIHASSSNAFPPSPALRQRVKRQTAGSEVAAASSVAGVGDALPGLALGPRVASLSNSGLEAQ